MIIASIVFFVVPSILVGALLKIGYASVIGMPFPLIILSIGVYILWRVRANRKARKQFNEMTAAAQPVMCDHEFRPPAIADAGTLPPLDNLANLAQSENENEKTNKTAEVLEVDNERTMKEH